MMTYCIFQPKTIFFFLGYLLLVASSQEIPIQQDAALHQNAGEIVPIIGSGGDNQGILFSSGCHFLPTLPQNHQSPLKRLTFVRGGGLRNRAVAVPPKDKNGKKGRHLSSGVERVRATAHRWKRKEFFTLLLLRIGFFITLPLSVPFLLLFLAIWWVTMVLRILTLGFVGREMSKVFYAIMKGLLAMTFASLTGVILPIFAMFGLVASLTVVACEIAEPLLRIKYRRILRKLRHLQKILSDPVLLETVDIMSRGAQAVAVVSSQRIQKASTATSKRVQNASVCAREQGRVQYDAVQDTSTQLIETLLESPGAIAWRENAKKRLPAPVVLWTREQIELLRKSGVLEEAATRALDALSKTEELSKAATLLPYIEAIGEVQKKLKNSKG